MTPTTSLAPVNTVTPVVAAPINPALKYEANLRAALKAVDLAAAHNPALLSTQFELLKALNTHLKLMKQLKDLSKTPGGMEALLAGVRAVA